MFVQQHCCKDDTHYPKQMKGCESIPHTIASYIGNNSAIDHIITIEKKKDTLDISDVNILQCLITDHKPIFCIINDIPIVSWNIEGLCNSNKLTEERFDKIKKKLKSLHQKYPNIIFLFQEIFLKSDFKDNTIERLKELFYHDDYTYISDQFTSGAIIPKHLFKKLDLIQRKNSRKHSMIIYIKSPKPFVLVNIHLKAVRSLRKYTINNTHINELNNIISHLHSHFKKGVVFIGDHNNKNVLPIYTELISS